jgi:hypothetical protein
MQIFSRSPAIKCRAKLTPTLRVEESDGASTSQPAVAPSRPLPTVSVVIDPTTGMLARFSKLQSRKVITICDHLKFLCCI